MGVSQERTVGQKNRAGGGKGKRVKGNFRNQHLPDIVIHFGQAEPITISDWFQTPPEPFHSFRYHHHPCHPSRSLSLPPLYDLVLQQMRPPPLLPHLTIPILNIYINNISNFIHNSKP